MWLRTKQIVLNVLREMGLIALHNFCVHWTISSKNLSLEVVFLYQSFLVLTVGGCLFP